MQVEADRHQPVPVHAPLCSAERSPEGTRLPSTESTAGVRRRQAPRGRERRVSARKPPALHSTTGRGSHSPLRGATSLPEPATSLCGSRLDGTPRCGAVVTPSRLHVLLLSGRAPSLSHHQSVSAACKTRGEPSGEGAVADVSRRSLRRYVFWRGRRRPRPASVVRRGASKQHPHRHHLRGGGTRIGSPRAEDLATGQVWSLVVGTFARFEQRAQGSHDRAIPVSTAVSGNLSRSADSMVGSRVVRWYA